jgi:hypothetical protein
MLDLHRIEPRIGVVAHETGEGDERPHVRSAARQRRAASAPKSNGASV